MPEEILSQSRLLIIVACVLVLAILVKVGMERLRLPAAVGYILLGLGLGWLAEATAIINLEAESTLSFLSTLGVACLLFKVGLSSDPRGLVAQLPRASVVWLANVVASAALGYLAVRYVLGFGIVPSLFGATALSATSVGVAIGEWQRAGAIKTPEGARLVDVAELDDLSAVVLMILVIASAPELASGGSPREALPVLLPLFGVLLAKGAVFALICYVFARFVERRATRLLATVAAPWDQILPVAGLGFLIAGLAGLLGFTVAIGAFFAGLAFSRDSAAVGGGTSFETLHDFFTPFFFLEIGRSVGPSILDASLGPGLVLIAAGVLGKVVGAGVPLLSSAGLRPALRIGVSMVPRAEIALVVVHTGKMLGPWAVPDGLFAAVVLVSAATCTLAPIALRGLLREVPGAVRSGGTPGSSRREAMRGSGIEKEAPDSRA